MSPERIRNQPYSYASDIWSLGLVLMECATGDNPLHGTNNCIEVAQTILDAEIPDLPPRFSPEFRDVVRQCLQRDPSRRLPAEVLLGSPWLVNNGATSIERAVENVYNWIHIGRHK